MRFLNRLIGAVLAACAVVRIAVMPAEAVSSSVTAYSQDQKNTVVIEVAEEPLEQPDFAGEFPEITSENAAGAKRPSADLAQQVRQEYVSVPLYYQNDYPDVMYGSGTVETSGCSITSVAMVATYLTGYEYLPDELAYYFGGRAENNIARLEYASKALELPYEKPENWHGTLAALKEGKIAIVLVNSRSIFSDSQHFIVLTGMTEDGKILVNDSYAPNYDRWDLKNAFKVGFDEGDICTGYEGAWVYDKSAMPEEIVRYVEEEPERGDPRYPEITLSFAEKQLLARVIWVEARGESAEGQQAVAEVVLNRMASDNFPDTLKEVIFGEGQFRSVPYLDDAEPGQAQYQALEKAMYGPYILPEDVVYFATSATNENVWGSIGGHVFCYDNDVTLD